MAVQDVPQRAARLGAEPFDCKRWLRSAGEARPLMVAMGLADSDRCKVFDSINGDCDRDLDGSGRGAREEDAFEEGLEVE